MIFTCTKIFLTKWEQLTGQFSERAVFMLTQRVWVRGSGNAFMFCGQCIQETKLTSGWDVLN